MAVTSDGRRWGQQQINSALMRTAARPEGLGGADGRAPDWVTLTPDGKTICGERSFELGIRG
jgi:hypothetical protein